MQAELFHRPISGTYEEHHFNTSNSSNMLWIRFLDHSYQEWIGVFGKGDWGSVKIITTNNEDEFLIIAGGIGYCININNRKLVYMVPCDSINDIVYNHTSKCFVITDGIRIFITKNNNLIWSSDSISVDGIQFTGQKGAMIYGILNDLTEKGCNFTFDSETKELSSKWIYHRDFNPK